MLVKKPVRKRTPRTEKQNNAAGKVTGSDDRTTGRSGQSKENNAVNKKGVISGVTEGIGSRFAVLENQENSNQDTTEGKDKDDMEGNYSTDELVNMSTVDLGATSQNIPNFMKNNNPFQLGRSSCQSQKSTLPKGGNKIYQEKRKSSNQGLLNVLNDIDPNSIQNLSTPTIKATTQGKENDMIIFQAQSQAITQAVRSKEIHAQSRQPQDASDDTSTPPHRPIISSNREDSLCRESDGRAIPGAGEPPDSCIGGKDGLVAGVCPGTARIGGELDATH